MDNVWGRIKKGLKDGASMSMEKIEEYTKVGKLKIDELAARRKIDRNFADIGQSVFDMVEQGRGGDVGKETVVQKAVGNIKQLRTEIAAIAVKIHEVQEEARRTRATRQHDDEEVTGA